MKEKLRQELIMILSDREKKITIHEMWNNSDDIISLQGSG